MIQKYGGRLVYAMRDEMGLIEVVEAGGVRSLHFDSVARQSAMSLSQPDWVELSYVRGLLQTLLYVPAPRRVLMLGLGGGSLAKFLFQQYPDCLIEAVEYRSGVPPVAHRFFGLPVNPRIHIHLEDGRAYAVREAQSGLARFDHIYIDAFDCQGLAECVNRHDFFLACKKLLHPQGILAINLWGTQADSFRESRRLLNLYFPGRIFRLDVPGRGNVIAMTPGASWVSPKPHQISERARLLEIRTGIEYSRFHRLTRPPVAARIQ